METSTNHNQKIPLSKDITVLLTEDHRFFNILFVNYEKSRSDIKKKQLVKKICSELIVHMQVKEEIFYPALKIALKDSRLIPEALIEHEILRGLIKQIENIDSSNEVFNAKVKVLSKHVKYQIREAHTDIFPKARSNWIDLIELGTRMMQRRSALFIERGEDETLRNNFNPDDLFAEPPSVGLGGRPPPDALQHFDRRINRTKTGTPIKR